MQKKFFEEIPFVRAIACIMVVFVHISSGTITADDGSTNTLNLYLYQLPRLGTPIFAVISAFLLFSSVKQRGFDLKRFFLSRTTKIVLPFVIWTLFYLWVKIYFYGDEVFTDAQSIMKYFLIGTGYYHLYFMITVIQFYIIFPLIQLIHKRTILLALFALSVLLNVYWFSGPEINTGIELLDVIMGHRSFVLNWIGFFLFGAVLAYYYSEVLAFVKRQKLLLFVLTGLMFILLCLEIDSENIFTSSRPANLIYVPIFVMYLLCIQGLAAKVPFLLKSLNVVGNYSMGIYLVHPVVKVVLKRILPSEYWQSGLILVTIGIVLVISMIIVRAILFLPKANFLIPIGKTKQKAMPLKGKFSDSMSKAI
jgi:probable poly-beta-1,6-N-acetyl-D-glucosamine export protein